MLELNRMQSGSKFVDILVAITVHCVLIGIPILAGLYFTDTLNLKALESTFLVSAASSSTSRCGRSGHQSSSHAMRL
jgi:hypothetical protein